MQRARLMLRDGTAPSKGSGHAGARHPCCARDARFKEQKDTGRRVADPNFFKSRFPGVRVSAISVPCVPRLRGPGLAYRHLDPLKRTEPRTGRSAGRAGNSPSRLLHARRFRRTRVSARHPFARASRDARIGNRTPRAPLPARKSGTDSPDLPLNGREPVGYGIYSYTCQMTPRSLAMSALLTQVARHLCSKHAGLEPARRLRASAAAVISRAT
jgi:hypothetical protein